MIGLHWYSVSLRRPLPISLDMRSSPHTIIPMVLLGSKENRKKDTCGSSKLMLRYCICDDLVLNLISLLFSFYCFILSF